MINKKMNDKAKFTGSEKNPTGRKPNENAGFSFSSSVKIFDPNTQQVILHKRGDV
jgi:hypothetical protein